MTPTLAERFFAQVSPEPTSGCWLWTGTANADGYGAIKLRRKALKAHRVSWLLHFGDPKERQVLHRCDNPSCVNPDHLWLGTHLENMRDKVRKGRSSSMHGASNPRARLTAEQVLELRALYATGQWRQVDLASRFGLKQPQVSEIVRRTSWSRI